MAGNKSNPIGFRTGIKIKSNSLYTWNSSYICNKKIFPRFIYEDNLIRTIILEKFDRIIHNINIERNNTNINIKIHTIKIGVFNDNIIKDIKEKIYKEFKKRGKIPLFSFIHFNLILVKIENSAKLIASEIVKNIETNMPYSRSIRKVLDELLYSKYYTKNTNSKKSIHSNLGILENILTGIKINISGKLNGVSIARTEKMQIGTIKLQTLDNIIDYAICEAKMKYGVIGVKVWIAYKNNN